MAFLSGNRRSKAVTFADLDSIFGASASIGVSPNDLRITDANGAVGNTVANGGVMSSNTDPILEASTAGTQDVLWAAASVVPVAFTLVLPTSFDGTKDVLLDLIVASGSTDAATMGIASAWDGGTVVSDSASDAATKSATFHTITATIDKADVPDAAKSVTIVVTPPAHATNAIKLRGIRLRSART